MLHSREGTCGTLRLTARTGEWQLAAGGSPCDIYQDYIDGKKEISEINMEYNDRYRQGRQIK